MTELLEKQTELPVSAGEDAQAGGNGSGLGVDDISIVGELGASSAGANDHHRTPKDECLPPPQWSRRHE